MDDNWIGFFCLVGMYVVGVITGLMAHTDPFDVHPCICNCDHAEVEP